MSQREEIQRRIDALRPWFHAHDLGDGLRIERDPVFGPERDYPARLWERVRGLLPVSPRGLRVLDVGCNSGYVSVALKRLGAASVTGVESYPPHLEQAKLVRELVGLELDLEPLSIYDLEPSRVGEFDLSLCLGVVYHLRHPLLGLERLASVTSGHAVVESAILSAPPIGRAAGLLGRLTRTGGSEEGYGGRPHVVHFIENAPGLEGLLNWFVPSMDALVAFVKAAGFREIVSAHAFEDRGIVVARRTP